jgi:hypothetical protein
MKIKRILYLSFALLLVFSIVGASVFAAVQEWKAVKPSYDTYVNGTKVSGMEVMNIDGRTYIQPTSLKPFGITNEYKDDDVDGNGKAAFFTIPSASTVEPQPNTLNLNSLSDLCKIGVMVFSNGQFKGNGLFYEGKYIIIPKSVWQFGAIVCKDYKNRNIPFKTVPVVSNDSIVLLETNGYTSDYSADVAKENEKSGNDVALISSISGVQNSINLSTIADYKQFNTVLAPQDGIYLRTYNNCNSTELGGGLYNNNNELVGMFIAKGPNYAIFLPAETINNFLD